MTSPHLRSIMLPFAVTFLGIALFSGMDALMKGLSIRIGAYNAMLWRLFIGTILGGLVYAASGSGARLPNWTRMRIHLIRGSVASFMAVTFFWGIARIPLAEGIAISFIAPLITLYLAALMLGEKITKHAVTASLFGLSGVCVIMLGRWSGASHDSQSWAGVGSILISAVLYAYNLVLQKQQAMQSSPQEIVFFQHLVALCVLALGSPWFAIVPTITDWPTITGSAILALLALGLLAWGYARAETQLLVSVEYTAFLWASLFGWYIYKEPVTLFTLAGVALIVSGCLIAARSARPIMVETA